MVPFNFGPACAGEDFVFGAEEPAAASSSYDDVGVSRWISAMRKHRIEAVVCLLSQKQLSNYCLSAGLLETAYKAAFPIATFPPVMMSSVEDLRLPDDQQLIEILEFLQVVASAKTRAVVHCAAGFGRTGVVHAAWCAVRCRIPAGLAIDFVRNAGGASRDPLEAEKNSPDETPRGSTVALIERMRKRFP